MFLHQPRSTTSTQQKTELNQDVLKCFKIDFVLPTKNGFGIFPVLCLLFWKALKVATCCEQNPCGKKTPVSRHGGRHLGEFNIRRYGGSVVKQPWDVWIWNQERKLIGCNLVLGDFFFCWGDVLRGWVKVVMATNGLFVDYESSESRWKSDSKLSTSPQLSIVSSLTYKRCGKIFEIIMEAHAHTHIYIYKHLHIHCSKCKWWIHVCETSMINLGIPNLAVHEVNRRCHLLSLPQLDLFLWNLGRWNIIGFTQIYIIWT